MRFANINPGAVQFAKAQGLELAYGIDENAVIICHKITEIIGEPSEVIAQAHLEVFTHVSIDCCQGSKVGAF